MDDNLSRGLLDDADNGMGRSIDQDGIVQGGMRTRSSSEEHGMLGTYTEYDGDEDTAPSATSRLDRDYLTRYQYYVNKGFRNILIKGLLDYITVLVVGLVLLLSIVAIDYKQLEGRIHNGSLCAGEKEDLFTVDCFGNHPINLHRLKEMSRFANFIIVVLIILWSGFVLQFLRRIPELRLAQTYYENTLKISHRQLQTIGWPAVLVKMVAASGGAMDPLKITHLITRRDNFYIALLTEEIINTDLQIPCYGKRRFMTDSFLWVLRGILDKVIFGESWNSFFCRDTAMRNTVVANEATKTKLRHALRLCGFCTLLLAPFLLIARLSVFFFRHSDQLRKSAGVMSARHWSPHAQIKLRDYCEVEHIFLQRMHKAHKPASLYVALFTSSTSVILARFFAFAFGCVFVMLVALGFVYDEDFLFQELSRDRSVTWWLGILGMLLAALHSSVPDENLVFEPAQELEQVRQLTHLHMRGNGIINDHDNQHDHDHNNHGHEHEHNQGNYVVHVPEDGWTGNEASLDTLNEFTELFQLKAVTLIEEVLGVLIIPYLLISRIAVDAEVGRIVDFFEENHQELDGLGDVCKLANLKEAGKPEFLTERSMADSLGGSRTELGMGGGGGGGGGGGEDGGVSTLMAARRSKMMQSMLSFTDQHTTWQPDDAGQTVLRQIDEQIDEYAFGGHYGAGAGAGQQYIGGGGGGGGGGAAWGNNNININNNNSNQHVVANGSNAGRWSSGSRNGGGGGGGGGNAMGGSIVNGSGGWRARSRQALPPRSRLDMFLSTDFQGGFTETSPMTSPLTEQPPPQQQQPQYDRDLYNQQQQQQLQEQQQLQLQQQQQQLLLQQQQQQRQQQYDQYEQSGPAAGSDHALSNSMIAATEERERQIAESQRLAEEKHRLQMQLSNSTGNSNGDGDGNGAGSDAGAGAAGGGGDDASSLPEYDASTMSPAAVQAMLPAAARAMPYDDSMHFQDGPGSLHADMPHPDGGP